MKKWKAAVVRDEEAWKYQSVSGKGFSTGDHNDNANNSPWWWWWFLMTMTMTMTMMVRSAAHSRCYPFHSKFFTTWALTANLRCTLSIDDIGDDDIEIEIRSVIAMKELLPPFLHSSSNLRSIKKSSQPASPSIGRLANQVWFYKAKYRTRDTKGG